MKPIIFFLTTLKALQTCQSPQLYLPKVLGSGAGELIINWAAFKESSYHFVLCGQSRDTTLHTGGTMVSGDPGVKS